MAISKAQKCLVSGFILVITSILYSALAARHAVLKEAISTNLSIALEEENQAVEEFRAVLDAAQASQQHYMKNPQPNSLKKYRNQLRLINDFREELESEAGFMKVEDPAYNFTLQQLIRRIILHLESLEKGIEGEPFEALAKDQQAAIVRQVQRSQANVEEALNAFLDVDVTGEEIELFSDIEIEARHKIWRIGFWAGIGVLATCSLCTWLLKFLGQQEQKIRALEQECQELSQSLKSQDIQLQGITSSLQRELRVKAPES